MVTAAYEKWLLMNADLYPPDEKRTTEEIVAGLLVRGCQEQNPQSFEIVDRVGDKNWTEETFMKAAKMVIEKSEEE